MKAHKTKDRNGNCSQKQKKSLHLNLTPSMGRSLLQRANSVLEGVATAWEYANLADQLTAPKGIQPSTQRRVITIQVSDKIAHTLPLTTGEVVLRVQELWTHGTDHNARCSTSLFSQPLQKLTYSKWTRFVQLLTTIRSTSNKDPIQTHVFCELVCVSTRSNNSTSETRHNLRSLPVLVHALAGSTTLQLDAYGRANEFDTCRSLSPPHWCAPSSQTSTTQRIWWCLGAISVIAPGHVVCKTNERTRKHILAGRSASVSFSWQFYCSATKQCRTRVVYGLQKP